MSPKTIVFITGANTGLGYEVVRALYKSSKPYSIILGCRTVSKGEEAISKIQKETPSSASLIEAVAIDVESDESIQQAYATISAKYGRVDVLINNAGASFERQIQDGSLTMREGWMKCWNVNVAGTQIVTTTFAPLLLKSSDPRLMFVTSGTSALTETEQFDYPPLAVLNKSPPAGWPKEALMNPVISYRSNENGFEYDDAGVDEDAEGGRCQGVGY